MKKLFVVFIFIYPFFVFSDFDDWLFPDDKPNDDIAVEEVDGNSLPDLDLKVLVDGCSSHDIEFCEEIKNRCKADQADSCKAFVSFQESYCDKGDALVCKSLGEFFEKGLVLGGKLVIKKNIRKAVAYAKKACVLSDDFCLLFGSRYLFGASLGYRPDPLAGVFIFNKLCSSGNAMSCFQLGKAYSSGDVLAKNHSLAFKYYFEACKISESLSYCRMGLEYEDGDDVPRNYKYAFKFYSFLCDKGDAMKCGLCGLYYAKGKGVKKDLKQSAVFFEKSCSLGENSSCSILGLYYEDGTGVEKDLYRSAQMHKKGCDMGAARSCFRLGKFYFSGAGVPKSAEDGEKFFFKAARIFKKSCSSGDKTSCDYYIKLYDLGYEVKD